MKRTITLALLIWLLVPQAAFGQIRIPDTDESVHSARNQKPDAADDDRDDIVTVVKKKKPVHKVLFGLEAGLSSCYLWRPDATNDPVLGSRLGGVLYVPLAGKLYFQPGLYYVTDGGSQTVATGQLHPPLMTTSYNAHAIELPLNLGFRFGHKKSRYKSFIGMGAYIARNLGGTVTFDDGVTLKDNLTIGSNAGENFNAFDYGLDMNAVIEWHSGVFMTGWFQYGFANLAPHVSTMNSMSDGFTVGYLFGKKSKLVSKKLKRMTRENDRYNDPRQHMPDTAD